MMLYTFLVIIYIKNLIHLFIQILHFLPQNKVTHLHFHPNTVQWIFSHIHDRKPLPYTKVSTCWLLNLHFENTQLWGHSLQILPKGPKVGLTGPHSVNFKEILLNTKCTLDHCQTTMVVVHEMLLSFSK